MSSHRMSRRRRVAQAILLVVALAAGTAGCANLNLGGNRATSWFTLNDMRADDPIGSPLVPAVPVAGNRQDTKRTLLIDPVDANPFYDSTQIAYSRSSVARAYYQYAAWTDRPSKRMALLIERRLARRPVFKAVAASTAGIRGDLSLQLRLDEIYHDAYTTPQKARIRVSAEIIDLRTRALVARESFSASGTVIVSDSTGAVRGLNEAMTTIIDQIALWVESYALKQDTRDAAQKEERVR